MPGCEKVLRPRKLSASHRNERISFQIRAEENQKSMSILMCKNTMVPKAAASQNLRLYQLLVAKIAFKRGNNQLLV